MAETTRKRIAVRDLLPNTNVDQVFVVRERDLRTTKSGDYYISLTLGDATGAVPGRMWQASEALYNGIPDGGFLHVKGRCEDYRGNSQIVVEAFRPVPADRVDMSDFLPVSPFDIEEMWSELLEILRAIQDRFIRGLIKKFMEDRQLVANFKRSPAAAQMHHAYVGGLLEHTRNIARAAQALLPMYPQLNPDLVFAGAFLHDIAKTGELTSGLTIRYTERGQLVGHLTMACGWVADKARLLAEELGEPFPETTLTLLQHLIISHHGEYQYGSSKLPAIPEAFFLHYLDNLDAKMWMTANAIAADNDPEGDFTSYVRQLETRLYKHSMTLGSTDDPDNEPRFELERP